MFIGFSNLVRAIYQTHSFAKPEASGYANVNANPLAKPDADGHANANFKTSPLAESYADADVNADTNAHADNAGHIGRAETTFAEFISSTQRLAQAG